MNEFEQAKQTFFEESRDMLRQIEDALLALESGTQDPETLNGLFRAAHTIKGSAGLFGFDRIGRFTHEVETVLDRLRSGEITFDPALAALLLPCADHIGRLLDETARSVELAETDVAGDGLLSRLTALSASPAPAAPRAATTVEPPAQDHCSKPWNIRVHFGADVFRNGMDPLSFLRYLGTKGDILDVSVTAPGMPETDAFDPESCFLTFEIVMQSDGTKADIVSVFDFVKDDCTLEILAPGDKISGWIDLLTRMPANEKRIGDMLVECGAVTRAELERAIRAQEDGATNQPLGQLLIEQNAAPKEVVQAAVSRQREQRSEEAKFIRVQADKLDSLISLVGELVIAGAGANLLARQAKDMRMLEATQSITDLVEEIRNGALQLRMVQIGETFTRFRRVVRDVSHELGKQIELVISVPRRNWTSR